MGKLAMHSHSSIAILILGLRYAVHCSTIRANKHGRLMGVEGGKRGELLTQSLLAEKQHHVKETGNKPNSAVHGEVKPGGYTSPVTGLLLLSTFVAVCASLNVGFAVGYSSPVQSKLMDDLGLSTAEYSLFGSFLTVGAALGAIVCGQTADYLGRRGTFWLTDVLSIGGRLAISISQGALSLYLGRLLLGFATGLISYTVPMYVAEITLKDHRGGLVLLNVLMLCVGVSTMFILGLFTSWRVLAAIGIIPNLSQLIGSFFIPESPRWLLMVNKEQEFKAALQRLRGASANISLEANDMKDYHQALEQTSGASIFRLFQRKYMYTLTVGIGLYTLMSLDGLSGIVYYAGSIFQAAGISSRVGTLMLAFIQVPPVLISVLLMDKYGRRPLLMVSAAGICFSCTLTGISFTLQDHSWLGGFSPYLALSSLLMYFVFYSMGLGGIPPLIISEIYPMDIKGSAGSLAHFAGSVTSWFIPFVFNFSMEWSSAGTFFILAGSCGFTLLFVAMLVPETKGKTLEEIQASIGHKFLTDHDLT